MPIRVALSGQEAAGVQVFRMLGERGLHPALVFSDRRPERGAAVADLAERAGVELRPAAALAEAATAGLLADRGVELLLNVHSLHVAAPEVVAAPPLGAYNLHPGPLPERAGLDVPLWALYEAASNHGVSLHRMAPQVDAGPIAFEGRFPVPEDANGLALSAECVRRGVGLVGSLLDCVLAGRPIPALAQDLRQRRWYEAGPPDGGAIDWAREAAEVCGHVRACDFGPLPSPWGRARTAAEAGPVGILDAVSSRQPADRPPGTVRSAAGTVMVATADHWIAVERIEVDGVEAAARDHLVAGERLRAPAAA